MVSDINNISHKLTYNLLSDVAMISMSYKGHDTTRHRIGWSGASYPGRVTGHLNGVQVRSGRPGGW